MDMVVGEWIFVAAFSNSELFFVIEPQTSDLILVSRKRQSVGPSSTRSAISSNQGQTPNS